MGLARRPGEVQVIADSVTGPLVEIAAIASQIPAVNPAIVADNVKVAGDVDSTAVSHIAVEVSPIPMQSAVVAAQVAEVGMYVIAIAFIPTSGSCTWADDFTQSP